MMIGSISNTSNTKNAVAYNSTEVTAAELAGAVGAQGEKKDTSDVKETENGVVVDISEHMKEMYQQQAESAKKAGEGMRDMAKLMEIARRIARGDHVPPSDEKKLAEFDSDLYQAAKTAGALNANKKHKKHDAMFDEDEKESKDEQLRGLRREAASNSTSSSEGSVSEAAVPESGEVVE